MKGFTYAWPSTTELPKWINDPSVKRVLIITQYKDGVDIREVDLCGEIHLGRYDNKGLERFNLIRRSVLRLLIDEMPVPWGTRDPSLRDYIEWRRDT